MPRRSDETVDVAADVATPEEERVEEETAEPATDGAESNEDVREHLGDVEDGCGCVEVWEHLSAGRE